MWARSEVVITPPCHGGDRRFKSGRARQQINATPKGWFLFACCPAGLAAAPSERSERAGSWSEALAEACFEKAERIKPAGRYSGRANRISSVVYLS